MMLLSSRDHRLHVGPFTAMLLFPAYVIAWLILTGVYVLTIAWRFTVWTYTVALPALVEWINKQSRDTHA